MLARHRETGAAATIAVAPLRSPFGVVDLGDDDVVTGFREAPELPNWVSCGVYVLGEEAIARLPERGDHEDTTFPELAARGAPPRVSTRGLLADGEHAQGSAAGGGGHVLGGGLDSRWEAGLGPWT